VLLCWVAHRRRFTRLWYLGVSGSRLLTVVQLHSAIPISDSHSISASAPAQDDSRSPRNLPARAIRSASAHVITKQTCGGLAPARYLCSPRMLGSEFVCPPLSLFHAILPRTFLHLPPICHLALNLVSSTLSCLFVSNGRCFSTSFFLAFDANTDTYLSS
jgi:hypothetical protein